LAVDPLGRVASRNAAEESVDLPVAGRLREHRGVPTDDLTGAVSVDAGRAVVPALDLPVEPRDDDPVARAAQDRREERPGRVGLRVLREAAGARTVAPIRAGRDESRRPTDDAARRARPRLPRPGLGNAIPRTASPPPAH